jgi:hypothetical protein
VEFGPQSCDSNLESMSDTHGSNRMVKKTSTSKGVVVGKKAAAFPGVDGSFRANLAIVFLEKVSPS